MPEAPKVRTHSVRDAEKPGGFRYLLCRGCGAAFDHTADREWLERQPCGTPDRTGAPS